MFVQRGGKIACQIWRCWKAIHMNKSHFRNVISCHDVKVFITVPWMMVLTNRRLLLFDALTTLQVFVSQLRWPFIVEWNTGWVHELNSFLEKRQLLTFGWFWQDNRYKASPERWVLPMSCRSVEGSVEMVWYLLHIFAFVIQLSRVVSKLQESTSFAKSNLLCSSR